MNDDRPARPITDAEQALIQMVVDARDDPKRIPDPLIRGYAERVAVEAVAEDVMQHLQALYNAREHAKQDFDTVLDGLPPYARRPTLARLQAAWEAQPEEP